MKVTIEKDELQRKLSDIQNIVEKKNTMPILNHFLLTVEKGGANITATDLETAFKEPISLTITEEGKMCIPARKLFEIVKEMDDSISLESVDSQWVKVRSGKSNFRLASLSADDFPVWPSIESTEELEVDSSLLLEMIDKSIYAAGEADTRYVLNGLLFHVKTNGSLIVVGTDGHRLALSEKTIAAKSKEEKKMIVSRKSIAELRRFLSNEEKPVKVLIGKNHVFFKIDDIQFLTRLIEGTYPNYDQVIPIANEKILSVDRNLLAKSLRRVSIMSKERSNAVKVDIDSNTVIISASNPDLGEASDEISASYSGGAMTIAFNARYILDALNVMTSQNVILKLNEPLSPTMIIEEGNDDYKCVVMPMRL
ncbi:DNA polymerase III subunit beta [Dissulfurispira thermophila]|uniref:Beta sliding clamp n=1 Tax=Dissulfurispira thermophila TaxID=2715679 RepID=A0A7G1GXN3_9BACT|nr:DNA polymerase III subunit beta [Dissulfurispira thermophila]BCB95080.1 DNA polymerase III subunit beta [Dissulfurispira thermophila]